MTKLNPAALAANSVQRPKRVAAMWLLATAASLAVIVTGLGGVMDAGEAPTNGPESMVAGDALDEHFGEITNATELLVVRSGRHSATDPEFQRFLEDVIEQVAQLEGVVPPANKAELRTSEDGSAVLVPLKRAGDDVDIRGLADFPSELGNTPGFDVAVTGSGIVSIDFDRLSSSDLKEGELKFGFPFMFLILLLVVGTVIGALVPVVMALFAILTALALTVIVGQAVDLSVFLVNMLVVMGLALGVDYSLFVLSRFREERAAGASRDAAIVTAGATASRAVLVSGFTFVIALFGMLLVPTTLMRSLALGAILVGITSVLAALTLLPALLRLLGDRVDSLRVPLLANVAERTQRDWRSGGWARVSRIVMRRPLPWAVGAAALLVLAALPAVKLETGSLGVGSLPEDTPSRQGYETLRENFPQAAYSPARVVITARDVTNHRVATGVDRLEELLKGDARYGVPRQTVSDDGRLLELAVPVGADARGANALDAVHDLRAKYIPDAFGEGAATRSGDGDNPRVGVAGESAFHLDYIGIMREWTAPSLAIILGLSFLVLLVVFRSIVVPIKAIALNLLSVGAAYGLLVLVFQEGWGAGVLGLEQVDTIDSWVPLFLFSVLFGLSMDYHVFLLTRIRERWTRTGDTREAIEWGVATTARLITGAALIIVAVFAGFARGDLVMFQQVGFGVVVALLIDATIIRGILLPATMVLLGNRNWYLPSWLDWLPRIDLEQMHRPRSGSSSAGGAEVV